MADTDITQYLSLPYTTVLKRDEDGDVIASIMELDGCVAHGSDESEALQNLHEAQLAWLEAAAGAGQDIPVPEIEEDLPSGKFVLRLPRSLHQKLNKLAKKDDISLNQLVVMAATEHVARREGRAEMKTNIMRLAAWRPAPVKWNRSPEEASASGEFLEALKEGAITGGEEPGAHRHHRYGPQRMRRG